MSVRRNWIRLILKMDDDEQVVLLLTSDPDEVGEHLDRRLLNDPVRATLLGTIRIALGWDDVEIDANDPAVRVRREMEAAFGRPNAAV